jgi:diacylglycerol kinase family enzyme
MQVRTQEGQCRFACSTASYGFIGDVLERSERMRWMGPVRYEIGGALSLAQLQSYPIRLWYREPAAPHPELKVCHSDCPVCSQPRSHTFDSEQLLSIVEEAVSADDDADSDLSEASPMPQARHMRGANGFGDLPVELHRLASAVASNCADATDSSSSSSASQVRLQRSAVSANDDGASSVGPISRCAAAAVQPQQVAVVDAGPAASAAECPGSRCSTSGGSNEPRRPLHMRSASGFGETAAFLQSSAVRGSISSALIAESATTRGEDSGSSKDSTVAMPFEPWLADLSPPTAETSAADGDASRWRLWSGEVASLMVVVTPTRSDKSKAGIVPHAHLSDGRVHLVIVRKCTRFQFLRFLVSLSRGGVDESLDYVEVREVEAWRLEELGQAMPQSSVWNVDGELMKTRHMSARCHHGLVQVFGRGPERL